MSDHVQLTGQQFVGALNKRWNFGCDQVACITGHDRSLVSFSSLGRFRSWYNKRPLRLCSRYAWKDDLASHLSTESNRCQNKSYFRVFSLLRLTGTNRLETKLKAPISKTILLSLGFGAHVMCNWSCQSRGGLLCFSFCCVFGFCREITLLIKFPIVVKFLVETKTILKGWIRICSWGNSLFGEDVIRCGVPIALATVWLSRSLV